MTEDDVKGGVPINVAIKTFCARHEAPFNAKRANEQAAHFLIMEALMALAMKEDPKGPEEIAAIFRRLSEGPPACCVIGDAAMADILARTPTATGDPRTDEEAAMMLSPGTGRWRSYPEEPMQAMQAEHGYWMALGPDARGDDEYMMALITRGHPRDAAAGEDVTAFCALERFKRSEVKEARRWFEKEMNEKAWEREGQKPS